MLQRGYVAIMSTLIIGSVGLFLVTSAGLIALGLGQSTSSQYRGEGALALVEGCLEDALMRIQLSAGYSGGVIIQPEGSCQITTTSAGNNWTIRAIGTVNSHQRTIEVQLTRGQFIQINRWQEI